MPDLKPVARPRESNSLPRALRSLSLGNLVFIAMTGACSKRTSEPDTATAGSSSAGQQSAARGGSEALGGQSAAGASTAGAPGASGRGGGGAGVALGEGGTSGAQTSTGGNTASAGQAGTSAGGSGPLVPEVRFVGRFDRSDAAGPRFAWSGSGIIASFNGTSVGVRLGGGQQYAVILDGVAQSKLIAGSGTTPVAQGLAAGTHVIELYRRTEANQGESQFLGFDFAGGALLPPPPAKSRRLEIVGDSISAGYGNEGANMSCPFSADTENHYLTYGAIAARELDADLVTIAWSGKGAVCNYGDAANSCVDPLPSYYERTLPNRVDSQWDFATWQPHAVIVNLGTNDFSTAIDPGQTEFEAGYKALLQSIRSKYKDAFLLCTNGPMLGGADLMVARTYVANVVKSLNDAGDPKVKAFDFAPQVSADGYGCDYHPSLATHRKMAVQLATELKTTLSW